MHKILTAAVLFAILIFPACPIAEAEELPSTTLIEKARDWNGAEITYIGEVIGDIMLRGEYAWINVSDGANTIGVWLPAQDTLQISHIGRYNMHGDTAQVTGIFYCACADHGGDLDIHATALDIISTGYPVTHPPAPEKILAATVLLLASLALGIWMFLSRHKKNREGTIYSGF
jgi:hypothetical protein